MNHQDFAVQLMRYRSTWGPNSLPDERAKMLWDRVKDMDAGWFSRTLDSLIASSRTAPMMPDFQEAVNVERTRLRSNSPSKAPGGLTNAWCDDCRGEGFFFARRGAEAVPYVFKCRCSVGHSDPRNWPHFCQEHADQGFVWADPSQFRRTS